MACKMPSSPPCDVSSEREADEAVQCGGRDGSQGASLDLGGGVACLWWGAHRSVVLGDEFSLLKPMYGGAKAIAKAERRARASEL